MVLFVQKVGVVGAGVMGAAIAEVMALNGKKVVLKDVQQRFVDRGLAQIEESLAGLVAFHASKAEREIERIENENGITLTDKQKESIRDAKRPTYSRERAEKVRAAIVGTTKYDAFADCDLVVEAVVEDVPIKHNVYGELETVVPSHAILATNTSGLSITELARPLQRRGRFIGMHFFNPPTTLPLVEVIPGLDTSESTVEDLMGFCQEIRNHRYPLQAIRVKETPGFLVNRILGRMLQEAFLCYEEGIASARDIDLGMKAGAGMPMGPLELADLIGIDVIWHVNKTMGEMGFPKEQRQARVIDQLYHAGRLGRKNGRGFYDYEDRSA